MPLLIVCVRVLCQVDDGGRDNEEGTRDDGECGTLRLGAEARANSSANAWTAYQTNCVRDEDPISVKSEKSFRSIWYMMSTVRWIRIPNPKSMFCIKYTDRPLWVM